MKLGVYLLDQVDITSQMLGGKAKNLAILMQNNFPVPNGFAVTLEAFNGDVLNKNAISQINNLIDKEKTYAVRSSALSEDALNESWAGQFESFLNVSQKDIIEKIVDCHNSKKSRAIAYSNDSEDFQIAVVVQEMLKPDYAGVIFTKNPITGADEMITEYIEGLGEDLVSGRKDPVQIIISKNSDLPNCPFDLESLCTIANKIVETFNGIPQDIEYAVVNGKIYILQSRPITTHNFVEENKQQLGTPEELFFWGPSRAEPKYMSDFHAGIEIFYNKLLKNKNMPQPPVTLILFNDHKVVWLLNENRFSKFTHEMFKYYEANCNIDDDIKHWNDFVDNKDLVSAFLQTEMAEFALYGAETEIIDRLKRFDIETRRKIISVFTTPNEETFLNKIDRELIECKNTKKMAEKYPWINDGYSGVYGLDEAEKYFEERLDILKDGLPDIEDLSNKRIKLIKEYNISDSEVKAMELLRKLIEFMDNRKAWMMKSRREIKETFNSSSHGIYFDGKKFKNLNREEAEELYNRYVSFKSATGILKGLVASNGNHHFVSGEVAVVTSPTDIVGTGKILVCPMTSPSYVPLMRKAKALVTDHGGTMSHAAIVAREFGLPAIVGTKSATRELKNGDKIMLNMLTGEIIR